MKYYLLDYEKDESYALLTDEIDGFDYGYKFFEEVSIKNEWPNNTSIGFSDSNPQGINLTDFVNNVMAFLIVSDEIKTIVEGEACSGLEFLPIKILNHKHRIASDTYWVINIIKQIECVDRDKSDFDEDIVDPDLIEGFRKLVLKDDMDKIQESIFRMKEQPRFIVFSENLVNKLKEKNVTGAVFHETQTITSFGL